MNTIKTLKAYIGNAKIPALLTPFFVMIEVVMEVAIPYLMSRMINDGIEQGSLAVIYRDSIFLLGLALCALIADILAGNFAADASSRFAFNLRSALLEKVSSFSFTTIDRFSRASLITRSTTDITSVQNAFQMLTRMAVRSPATLLFALFMAFRMDANLAWIFAVLLPILALGIGLLSVRVGPLFQQIFENYDTLTTISGENVRAVRVVKSFVRAAYENRRFVKASQEGFRLSVKTDRMMALFFPLMQGTTYLALLGVIYLGGRAIIKGDMQTGELVAFIAYATQILISLMMLSLVFVMLFMSRAAARRVAEVLSTEESLLSPVDGRKTIDDYTITLKGAGLCYGQDERAAIKDVSLSIAPGEVVGIAGPTASGKSSLLMLLPRLYEASYGKVEIGGVDVKDYDLGMLRKNVHMVLQSPSLFCGTIAENLRRGKPSAKDDELYAALHAASAYDFVMEAGGLSALVAEEGNNFSGGQKARLALASALVLKPNILILDDTTRAVDVRTNAKIQKALRLFLPKSTILIVAQRPDTLKACDRVLFIDGGRLTYDANHETLLKTSPRYQDLMAEGGKNDEATCTEG